MTPVTALDLDFADGVYHFDLKLPQLGELQEKRKCGVFALYGRVMRGRGIYEGIPVGVAWEGEAYAEDLWETIRLALIGGASGVVDGKEIAVSPASAKTLVERYCHTAPLTESWAVAAAILLARVEGFDPEGQKKSPPVARRRAARTGSTSGKPSQTAL